MDDNRKKVGLGFLSRVVLLIIFLGGLGICGYYYFMIPGSVESAKTLSETLPVVPPLPKEQLRSATLIDKVLLAERLPDMVSDERATSRESAPIPPDIKILTPYARKTAVAGKLERDGGRLKADILPAEDKKQERYSLRVKGEVSGADLAGVVAKVRKSGYEPEVLQEKRGVEMIRLLVGTYSTEKAQEVLANILPLVPEAFSLSHGNRSAVYAGSYRVKNLAGDRADFLASEGVEVEEVKAEIKMIFQQVVFGDFKDIDEARSVAGEVKAVGLEVILIEQP